MGALVTVSAFSVPRCIGLHREIHYYRGRGSGLVGPWIPVSTEGSSKTFHGVAAQIRPNAFFMHYRQAANQVNVEIKNVLLKRHIVLESLRLESSCCEVM